MLGQVQVCILVAHQLNKYRDIRLILSCFVEASAALLGQAQVCILVAHQQGPCVHFLDNQIYMRLIALLRILSCFLEASAALLGQVQVCIVAHQQSPVNKKGCSNFSDATKRRLEDGWPESMSSARRQVILASSLRKFSAQVPLSKLLARFF